MVLYDWWKEKDPYFSKHLQTMSGGQVEIAVVPEILDVQFFPIQVDSTLLLAVHRARLQFDSVNLWSVPIFSVLFWLFWLLKSNFDSNFPWKNVSHPIHRISPMFPLVLRQSDQSWPCYVVDTLWQQRANVVLRVAAVRHYRALSPSSNQWVSLPSSNQWVSNVPTMDILWYIDHVSFNTSFPNQVFCNGWHHL